MRVYTIDAESAEEAASICSSEHGFTPDAVREVDSGDDGRAWKCFESSVGADLWDKQI